MVKMKGIVVIKHEALEDVYISARHIVRWFSQDCAVQFPGQPIIRETVVWTSDGENETYPGDHCELISKAMRR